ncbi:Bromodomain-containing protein [Atractiella rhizophila]|nr:Bromodomain-containing protein [Atractiella rhizophila]
MSDLHGTERKPRGIEGLDESVILPDNLRKRKRATTESSDVPKEPVQENALENEDLATVNHDDDGIERYTADVFLNLPSKKDYADYYETIKKPISFNEITASNANKYGSTQEVKGDFDLVFNKHAFLCPSPCSLIPNSPVRNVITRADQAFIVSPAGFIDMVEDQPRLIYDVFFTLPDRKEYPDYYQIIKRPTSIESILARANKGEISSVEQLHAEFELIWKNAQTYNADESIIFQDSLKLQQATSSFISTLTGAELTTMPKVEEDDDDDDVYESEDNEEGKSRKRKRTKAEPGEKRLVFKTWLTQKTQELVGYKDESGREYSENFMDLPNEKEYPEYYKVIRKPVCFSGIFERIEKRHYHIPENWYRDVEIMIANALSYNEDESRIWRDAKMLQNKFNEIKAGGYPPFPFLAKRAERMALKEKEAQKKARLEQEAQEKARQEHEQRLLAEAALQRPVSPASPSPGIPSQALTPSFTPDYSKPSTPSAMDVVSDEVSRPDEVTGSVIPAHSQVNSRSSSQNVGNLQRHVPQPLQSAAQSHQYQAPRQQQPMPMTNQQMIQNYLNGAERPQGTNTARPARSQHGGLLQQPQTPQQHGGLYARGSNVSYPAAKQVLPNPTSAPLTPIRRNFVKLPTEMEPSLIEEFHVVTDALTPAIVLENAKVRQHSLVFPSSVQVVNIYAIPRTHFPAHDRPSEHTRSAQRAAEKPHTQTPEVQVSIASRPIVHTTATEPENEWKQKGVSRKFIISPRTGLTVLEFRAQKVGSKAEPELLRLYFTKTR